MTTRIYLVEPIAPIALTAKLVRAGSQSQATHHLTKNLFKVRVATQDDMAEMIALGNKIENAEASE